MKLNITSDKKELILTEKEANKLIELNNCENTAREFKQSKEYCRGSNKYIYYSTTVNLYNLDINILPNKFKLLKESGEVSITLCCESKTTRRQYENRELDNCNWSKTKFYIII